MSEDTDHIDAQLDRILKPAELYAAPVTLDRDGCPEVPKDYWETAQEAANQLARKNVPQDRGERLEGLVDKALDTAEEILSIEIDPFMPDSVRFISVKKDAAVAVLTLANKVDENRFRKRSASALLGILEKLTAQERLQTLS